MNARVAVLGTGRMGSAIAQRLAKQGVELVLWNRTRSRAEDVGVGAIAATPAEAVARAGIVITSLTGPDALQATFGGPRGALAAARGHAFVEMSTVGPDVLERLAPLVASTQSSLVDAPLIGAPPSVLRGAELVVVGGDRGDVERVRPVLVHLGEVRHVGPLGSGARLKLVANSLLGTLVVIAGELEAAGERIGLAREAIFGVLTHLAPSLEVRRAGYVEDQHEPTLFALRDLRKDLDLAVTLFDRAGADIPITARVRELIGEASVDYGDLDVSAVARRYGTSPGSAARRLDRPLVET
jgi:3-hydroxyisobutyrate dehydrogenase-like beta-hydroxyacid dehydrogenase